MKTIYLECNMGAAGDMLMSALYEICDQKEWFLHKMNTVFAPYHIVLSPESAVSCGINGTHMKVTVDGEVYGTYSLAENQTVKIQTGHGTNVLVIENGSVHMEEADCPDGYCKRQGTISRVNETIVCLPHKLVAEVESDGSTTDDADDAPDVIVK